MNEEPDKLRILRQIFAGSGDAIVFADRDGKIRLWNGGAERIFGYGESEALGSTLDLIVPERFRERHWEGYHRVVKTGETQYGGQAAVGARHSAGWRPDITGVHRSPDQREMTARSRVWRR